MNTPRMRTHEELALIAKMKKKEEIRNAKLIAVEVVKLLKKEKS